MSVADWPAVSVPRLIPGPVRLAIVKLPAGTPLPEIELTGRWALAFWGGDFYFFTDSQTTPGVSEVTKYDYDGDKSIEVIVGASPMPIVGAGTSTCVSTGEG